MSWRVCSSVVERGIADPAVAGSIPVAPWTKFEEFIFTADTLAEWLRRQPAKLVGSARTGSNPVGVDPDVDGLMWIMSWSSNGATVWDDPTGCAVAGSILSAHFSQIKTFSLRFDPVRSRW